MYSLSNHFLLADNLGYCVYIYNSYTVVEYFQIVHQKSVPIYTPINSEWKVHSYFPRPSQALILSISIIFAIVIGKII